MCSVYANMFFFVTAKTQNRLSQLLCGTWHCYMIKHDVSCLNVTKSPKDSAKRMLTSEEYFETSQFQEKNQIFLDKLNFGEVSPEVYNVKKK